MLLTKLNIAKLGPFFHSVQIPIERDVTILTGSNDTGKSSVLRLLKKLLDQESATEMDINQDHLLESQAKWTEDTVPTMAAEFQLEAKSEAKTRNWEFTPGDSAVFRKRMAMPGGNHDFEVKSKAHGVTNWAVSLPKCTLGPSGDLIRDQIDLAQPTPLEAALLQLGFGAPFSFDRLNALGPVNFSLQLRSAEEQINQEMARTMPTPSSLRFHFQTLEGNKRMMAIILRDRFGAATPFGLRGSGLRRMVTLIAELLTSETDAHHRILLLDEPENSLHADAQHLLREFLFGLASAGKTQVIYATHSPSMINPMRPEQIRLLAREVRNGKATSRVEKRSTESNFLPLRTSLGISAADSLLFAPVTVVVEGDTEVKCLGLLFRKLTESGATGFEDAAKLLSLAHFLDGMGDNYEFLCRIAKSQGTRVVVFLDGDKRKLVEQQKVRETHPDVPIILLPNRDEFEQLVPVEFYFNAVAEVVERPEEGSRLLSDWTSWVAEDEKRGRKAFSKQVGSWLDEKFEELPVSKPGIMRRAVELAPADRINSKPLLDLLSAIREHLNDTSFR